jgi:hypothetical protein
VRFARVSDLGARQIKMLAREESFLARQPNRVARQVLLCSQIAETATFPPPLTAKLINPSSFRYNSPMTWQPPG